MTNSSDKRNGVNTNNSGDKRISTYDGRDEGDRVNIDRQWQVNTYDGGDEDKVYRDRVNTNSDDERVNVDNRC